MSTPKSIADIVTKIQALLPAYSVLARRAETLPFRIEERRVEDFARPNKYHIEAIRIPQEVKEVWWIDFLAPVDAREPYEVILKHFSRIQLSHYTADRLTARVDSLELKAEPTPAPELYTVVAVSSNTNSFGLGGVVCLAPSGKGVEAGIQAYGSNPLPQSGDTFTLEQLRSRSGITLRELKTITPEEAAEVLAEVNAEG